MKLSAGERVVSACRGVGIRDATYDNWRKRFGGLGRAKLPELKTLETETARLKKNEPFCPPLVRGQWANAELELDKLILKERLRHLKPRLPLTGSALREQCHEGRP